MSLETDLAYLAGMIDADGYVTASYVDRGAILPDVGAQIGITGSRREPHDLAAGIFGGNVSCHVPLSGHKPQFHWQRAGRSAVPVLSALLPYLRVKREPAELVLALQDQLEELRMSRDVGDFAPWQLADYDAVAHLRRIVDEIRACHSRRGRLAISR